MKCPYCGSACADEALYCPSCKQPLPSASGEDKKGHKTEKPRRTPLQRLSTALLALAFLAGLCVGLYKLFSWVDNYQLNRLYTRGVYTPTLSQVNMDDMRQGHAIIFYGKDGDQIFLPEMNRSLTISGGVARVEVADADWFGNSVTDVEYADITLSPMLITENGQKTRLPKVNFQVEVPESPLKVTSPSSNRITVVTGVYPLILNVVPGSTVFVNGQDVTGSVDRSGFLSTNVSVKPIGDNVITLIVRTPKHRERRSEMVIFRQPYDINLELDTSVSDQSTARTMAITGTTEPGAVITVDTDYLEESLSIDMTTGRFSFIAQFANFGSNVVRFRASMAGKEDAIVSFTVNYKPSISDMAAQAWKMDYPKLQELFEQWRWKVFACRGEIVDIVQDEDATYLIMDVGTDSRQLVVLENQSDMSNVTMGRRYLGYAYVSGQHMYQSQYYPKLICLYLDYSST